MARVAGRQSSKRFLLPISVPSLFLKGKGAEEKKANSLPAGKSHNVNFRRIKIITWETIGYKEQNFSPSKFYTMSAITTYQRALLWNIPLELWEGILAKFIFQIGKNLEFEKPRVRLSMKGKGKRQAHKARCALIHPCVRALGRTRPCSQPAEDSSRGRHSAGLSGMVYLLNETIHSVSSQECLPSPQRLPRIN